MKIDTKRPEFWISAAGLTVLAAIFLNWCIGADVTAAGFIAALLSVTLFAAVCLRFVPEWVRFWKTGFSDCAEYSQENVPKHIELKIFFSLIAVDIAVVLLVYLLRRIMGIAGAGESFAESFDFWRCTDSAHYIDIARDWYLSSGDYDRLVQLVFFPGYPVIMRLFNVVIGNYLYSGMIVSGICFALSGCVIYRLLRLDHSHSDSIRMIRLLCIMPGAFFFAAPMSESLFMLMCALTIYCVRTDKWLIGCLFGAYAAFTRSLGITLIVPILFEAIAGYMRTKDEKGSKKRLIARLALMLIVPLGFIAYLYINYRVSGDPFKFMEYQHDNWGQNLGWFFNTAAYQTQMAIECSTTKVQNMLGLWIPNLIACFGSLALMFFSVKKMRPSYAAWFIGYYVVAIGTTWLLSAPRYLIAFFPVPLALSIVAKGRKKEIAATVTCAVLSLLYLCAFVLRWQVW